MRAISLFVGERKLMNHFVVKFASSFSSFGCGIAMNSYGSPKHATALSHMIFRIMSGFSDFHAKT